MAKTLHGIVHADMTTVGVRTFVLQHQTDLGVHALTGLTSMELNVRFPVSSSFLLKERACVRAFPACVRGRGLHLSICVFC